MREPQEPLFLARQSYRRRRLMDAARLMPVAGVLFFSVPLLWTNPLTSVGWIYLFTVWGLLILLSLFLSRRLVETAPREDGRKPGEEG